MVTWFASGDAAVTAAEAALENGASEGAINLLQEAKSFYNRAQVWRTARVLHINWAQVRRDRLKHLVQTPPNSRRAKHDDSCTSINWPELLHILTACYCIGPSFSPPVVKSYYDDLVDQVTSLLQARPCDNEAVNMAIELQDNINGIYDRWVSRFSFREQNSRYDRLLTLTEDSRRCLVYICG